MLTRSSGVRPRLEQVVAARIAVFGMNLDTGHGLSTD